MAFEITSTNLVIEFGVILALLMGWQFTLAEFTGGPVMIVLIAVLFRLILRERLVSEARLQAKIPDQGVSWDYTTWLNLVFLSLAAALIIRFVRTGGVAMLRMMGGSPQDHMDAHVSRTH